MCEKDESAYVYDIYIMTYGGLPLYGGCTKSEFCQQHLGQHALHCGFFAALKSFCQEAFGQYTIHLIKMEDISVHLMTEPTREVMFAGVYPQSFSENTAREQLEQMMSRFMEKYGDQVATSAICDESIFDSFTEDLVELRIIPNTDIQCSMPIQFEEGSQKVKMPVWRE
jgi:hypothetical protein